ncbi:MAG: RIP metalloprotease RseP [Candidatus Portnoybacteria bacterium]|nr:RIP metalloprotease RseP [Candidatus Portnoybacteria bacterium]
MTILIFIAILVILVLVHEFGHFLAAKLFGIKVLEFGIGFPPKLASIKKGDTEYSLNLLPLGGFVRIFGEEGEEKTNPRSYASRPAYQRALIVANGVFFNIVFAFFIFWLGFSIGFPMALGEDVGKGEVIQQGVQILDVVKESPAKEAGLMRGDSIVKVQSSLTSGASVLQRQNFKVQNDIKKVEDLQKFTKGEEDQVLTLTIKRGKEIIEKEVLARAKPPEGQGAMGVVLADIGLVKYPVGEAFLRALEITAKNIWFILLGIFLLLKSLFVSGKLIGEVSGPVGIAVMTGQFYALGIHYLIFFISLISINLAVLNILPIPALDGGRLLFIVIEKLKGSPVTQETENKVHAIGFALLIGLVLLVTIRDILQL